MYCDFQQIEPGVYRCMNAGCGITHRNVDNPERIHPARCQSPVMIEQLERAGLTPACGHLGGWTNEKVKRCGCHVPEWQKTYRICSLHEKCIMLKLHNKPAIRNCQKCPDNTTRKPTT